MKKPLSIMLAGALLMAAAAGGSALAGVTRHPVGVNTSVPAMGYMHAVSPSCAPFGGAEFSDPTITNDTGAVLPKGTTIYWTAHVGNSAPFRKGHVTLTSDLAKGATHALATGLAGRSYSCSAVFFEFQP